MKTTQPQPDAKQTPRPKIRQAIADLLTAVDRSIEAADEAKRARSNLMRLAESMEGQRQ